MCMSSGSGQELMSVQLTVLKSWMYARLSDIGACRPGYIWALPGLFRIMRTHITRTKREDMWSPAYSISCGKRLAWVPTQLCRHLCSQICLELNNWNFCTLVAVNIATPTVTTYFVLVKIHIVLTIIHSTNKTLSCDWELNRLNNDIFLRAACTSSHVSSPNLSHF